MIFQIIDKTSVFVGHYKTSTAYEIILKNDRTFIKLQPNAWDSQSKKYQIHPKWETREDTVILKWGLLFKKSEKYINIVYNQNKFLIPINEIEEFKQLIETSPVNVEDRVVRNEKINSYYRKID
jgi:hypothetical protein